MRRWRQNLLARAEQIRTTSPRIGGVAASLEPDEAATATEWLCDVSGRESFTAEEAWGLTHTWRWHRGD